MALPRLQFTIGLLVELVLLFAALFALLGAHYDLVTACIAYWVAMLIISDLQKREMRFGGSTLARCLVFVGIGIVSCAYCYFSHSSRYFIVALVLGPLIASIPESFWRGSVRTARRLIVKVADLFSERALTDDSCGPIVWHALVELPRQRQR
jgi:hypothetical protein